MYVTSCSIHMVFWQQLFLNELIRTRARVWTMTVHKPGFKGQKLYQIKLKAINMYLQKRLQACKSALSYGLKSFIVIAGRNKMVPYLEQAMVRIRVILVNQDLGI